MLACIYKGIWRIKTNQELDEIIKRKNIIGDRKTKRLQMGIKLSTLVTGHGTLRSYYHRFKIIDELECVCKMGPQTTDHLIWECEQLRKQRETLKIG